MKYEKHVDGLRALAVLAVVADHLGYSKLSGGFVGVDVFFVISGYLITGILVEDLSAGRFSIRRFYNRRIRRIYPALIAMLAAVLICGLFGLFPSEFRDLSLSGLAALFSVANIWFWTQVGYFGGEALEKPLLHTWSLGVEEHFYLLYPFVLALLYRRYQTNLARPLAFATVLLCLIAIAWTYLDADSAFYLLPARAWELSLGAAVAVYRGKPLVHAWMLTTAGMAAILVPVFAYSHTTLFPGLAAVPVCLGTAALLMLRDHPDSLGARMLGCAPASFVGRISYSLYLWHWPVIVLQRMLNVLSLPGQDLGRLAWHGMRAAEFAVIFTLATMSYFLVERPFRRASHGSRLGTLAPIAIGAVVTAAGFGVVLVTGGLGERFPAKAVQYEAYIHYDATPFRKANCMLLADSPATRFPLASCMKFDPNAANVLLMGDSHAEHLWYGLAAALPHANVMQVAALGCRPIARDGSPGSGSGCAQLFDDMYGEVLAEKRPDVLVLAGRWSDDDLVHLKHTLARTKELGIQTLLIGPIVEYDMALPRLLASEVASGRPSFTSEHLVQNRFHLDARMAKLAAESSTDYFSPTTFLCPNKECIEVIDGVPTSFDYGHFTREGSVLVGAAIAKRFPAAAWRGVNVKSGVRNGLGAG